MRIREHIETMASKTSKFVSMFSIEHIAVLKIKNRNLEMSACVVLVGADFCHFLVLWSRRMRSISIARCRGLTCVEKRIIWQTNIHNLLTNIIECDFKCVPYCSIQGHMKTRTSHMAAVHFWILPEPSKACKTMNIVTKKWQQGFH